MDGCGLDFIKLSKLYEMHLKVNQEQQFMNFRSLKAQSSKAWVQA